MYLVLENSDKSFSFPENKTLLVGNDFDCDVQINHAKIWGKHFSIVEHEYGCVLTVYNDALMVNEIPISEQCMLDSGDVITVDELSFKLLDDSFVPKDSNLDPELEDLSPLDNMSSVFGLRSHVPSQAGQFIIDHFNHPKGWHVYRYNHELHLIDDQGYTLLNGLPVGRAQLKNGDVIDCGKERFKVELPGSSGFSKFSPSHPRNVQLSESFASTRATEDFNERKAASKPGFLAKNLWWLTLLAGLIVLLLAILNNQA